jgi:hypothetical protein
VRLAAIIRRTFGGISDSAAAIAAMLAALFKRRRRVKRPAGMTSAVKSPISRILLKKLMVL